MKDSRNKAYSSENIPPRRLFLFQAAATLASSIIGLPIQACKTPQNLLQSTLFTAGNAREEKARFQILQDLLSKGNLDPLVVSQLKELLPYIERWANGKEIALAEWTDQENKPYLSWSVRGGRLDQNIPPKPPEDSPIYPLWCLYRGRMLIWMAIEDGSIKGNPERMANYCAETIKLLEIAQKAFPENNIIKLYLGRKENWPTTLPSFEKAPKWALAQRTAMSGMQNIIHWWIDNRQLEDGQYGGGWGDDVEMWRWWTPWLIGLQDEKINTAQARLSRGLFQTQKMAGGYTNKMDDVEHTAEDSADTITAMMHLDPKNLDWTSRALHLVKRMKELWTGVNDRGFLQFKSTYFTDTEVDLTARKACDTVYHPRAIQPALLLWQRTGNPELTELFTQWLRTWVDATARAERGKPAGIIPSAIHWPDGKVGGLGKDWWKPGNYTDNPLYVWPSSMSMMTNSLLLAFHMTGDRIFLEPINSMAEIRLRYFRKSFVQPEVEGSEDWCASQMSKFLPGTLAKYRVLTGDTQYDELLQSEPDPYSQYSFFDKEEFYELGMDTNATVFSQNFPCFTSEVRWTDRVISFNKNYLKEVYPDTPIPDHQLLYSSLTGDPGSPLYFPLNGFQWLTDKNDLAVRVKRQSSQSAQIELFGFFEGFQLVKVKSFLLQNGSYQFILLGTGKQILKKWKIRLNNTINEIDLSIPGNQALFLEISKE